MSQAAQTAPESVKEDAAVSTDTAITTAEAAAPQEKPAEKPTPAEKPKPSAKNGSKSPKESKASPTGSKQATHREAEPKATKPSNKHARPPAKKPGHDQRLVPIDKAMEQALSSGQPVDAKRIFVIPITSIEGYDNPRHEPEHLYEMGYVLFGDPNVEEPNLAKKQYVSLAHLALSDNIQKVRFFVELMEKHETVDRAASPSAPQSIMELASDIKMFTQMMPILVKRHGRKHGVPAFWMADGGRRLSAILYLHARSRVDIEDKKDGAPKKPFPASVVATDLECTEDELFQRSVIVNFSRKGFSELQQGRVCHEMLKRLNPETVKGGKLYDKKHPDGRRYHQKEAAAALNMTLGTFRYRDALWHPYNPSKGTGLTDDDRAKIAAGKLNPSFASKKSLGEPVKGTGHRKKTKHRPLGMREMEQLFDETPSTNRERRQAIADCMNINIQRAVRESMDRQEANLEPNPRGRKGKHRRRRAA